MYVFMLPKSPQCVTALLSCWLVAVAKLLLITLKSFQLNTALFTVTGRLVKPCKQQHKWVHMFSLYQCWCLKCCGLMCELSLILLLMMHFAQGGSQL